MSLVLIALLSLVVAFNGGLVEDVSQGLMRDTAQAGVGLLIAYSVAIANAEPVLGRKSPRTAHEAWIGVMTGIGAGGLIGIGVGLLSGNASDGGMVDSLQASWVFCSIGALGVLVAALPVASYSWRQAEAEETD